MSDKPTDKDELESQDLDKVAGGGKFETEAGHVGWIERPEGFGPKTGQTE